MTKEEVTKRIRELFPQNERIVWTSLKMSEGTIPELTTEEMVEPVEPLRVKKASGLDGII